MRKPAMKSYPAEVKERAVTLAVESDQPIAQTARDLGGNENTLHTWIGKYHRVDRQEKQVNAEHLYEARKRLRKENARLKEERAILKKAAAYFAQQRPCSTPGCNRRSAACVACVASWRSRGVATTSGSAAHPAFTRQPPRSDATKSRGILPRDAGRMARAGSRLCWPRKVSW